MTISRNINRLLSIFGLQVIRRTHDSDFDSFMLTPAYALMLREEIGNIAFNFLSEKRPFELPSRENLQNLVNEFFDLFPARPVARNTHGSGFDGCFWLFLTARCISPSVIAESGVQRGQTTWILRQACPDANILCFDINLRRLIYRDQAAHYFENDWYEEVLEGIDLGSSLGFFDDHVNQALRIKQAHDRGMRRLLFDDTVPVHKIYADGEPPLPTVDMLLDSRAKVGDVIEWIYKGTKHTYEYKPEDQHGAAQLIQQYFMFPDLASRIRLGANSFLSFARLVD